MVCYTTLAQKRVCAHHPIPMVFHDVRLIDRLISLCSSPSSFPFTTAPPPTEESCTLAEFTPHTGYKPKLFDDFHFSETTEIIFQEQSGDKDTVPSYLREVELDDETIGKALSSPQFIQEREEPADRRQAYHSYEESLLPAQSFAVCHSRTERPVHKLRSLSSCKEKPSREMENETIRILFERQKNIFSLILEPRFKDTNFKPILTGEISRN